MSDLFLIRDSRLPLLMALSTVEAARRDALAIEALPIFTDVGAQDAENFRERLRAYAASGNTDAMLALIRGSFTEFRYDDFPQLEAHYQDVLALMMALLGDYIEKCDFRPGVVEWIVASPDARRHIVFNLRGSAEEAAEKITFNDTPDAERIGVSFSAFDRTIDRWTPLR